MVILDSVLFIRGVALVFLLGYLIGLVIEKIFHVKL